MFNTQLLDRTNRAVIYSALLLALFWGLAEHFVGLKEFGVSDSDEFFYWQTAKEWSAGEVTLTSHYRPVAYLLYSLAFDLFGAHDYTHKFVNSFCDIGAVLMAVLIGKKFFSNWLIGAMAGTLYLLAPTITFHSRHGIIHSATAFAVLVHIYFLFLSMHTKKKKLTLFASGVALSLSANLHPDLLVLGVPSFLVLIMEKFSTDEKGTDILTQLAVFLLGAASVYLVVFAYFGFAETISCMLYGRKLQKTNNKYSFFIHFFRIAYHYIRHNTSKLNVVLLFLAALYTIYRLYRKHYWMKKVFYLLIIITGYLTLCKFLFGRTLIPRLFIPFVILTYISVFYVINDILRPKKWALGATGACFLILLYSIRVERPTPIFLPSESSVSFYKIIHNQLSGKIGPDENYLITPFTTYHIHQPLEKEVYLNGNGIYLALSPFETIEDVIRAKKIRYIMWSKKNLDPRIFGRNQRDIIATRLRRFYGIEPDLYNESVELKLLMDKLKNYKLTKIHTSPEVDLYMIEEPANG